jgi:hypothetical protein
MEEIVANALAVDSDDTTNAEKVLGRDSNAVKSTVFPEWKKIGALLANEDRGPSLVCCALQGQCVAHGVLSMIGLSTFDQALFYIVAALFGLSQAVLTLCVTSTRVALMPGGKLDQLGVGEVMVSERDAASNARWRKGLLALSALFVLNGSLYIAMGVFELPPLPPGAPVVIRMIFMLQGLVLMTASPIINSGWWASMRTASCLCRDASVEVVKDVRATDPNDEEQWEAKVIQPALALREKFELLSDGWSSGLLGAFLCFWLLALACFTMFLHPSVDEDDRAFLLVWIVVGALLPFPLAIDIASTSSWCDTLMAELNEARIKHGKASHLNIQCLETSLKQLVRCPFTKFVPHLHATFVSCLTTRSAHFHASCLLHYGRTTAKASASCSGAACSTSAASRPCSSSSSPPSPPLSATYSCSQTTSPPTL